jgi:predicted RecA/RadA family phage recombinase
MAKFIQELDRIDFKNATTEAIAVGDIVPIGKMHGVAITDIAPNAVGAVKVTGCFEVAALASDSFAVGDNVYFDKAQKRASKTDTNPVLGVAITEKRPGTTVLEVALVPNIEK